MYTNRETAPKGFLEFYRFVTLPIGILSLLWDIYQADSLLETGVDGFVRLAIVYDILMIVLAIVCIYGLGKWAWYSYVCALVYQWAAVGLNLCILLLLGFEDATTTSTYIGRLIGSLIWAVGVTIYLVHRKPLFDKNYSQPTESTAIANEGTEDVNGKVEEENKEKLKVDNTATTFQYYLYCNKCGSPLINGAKFCSKCGAVTPSLAQESSISNVQEANVDSNPIDIINECVNDKASNGESEDSEITQSETDSSLGTENKSSIDREIAEGIAKAGSGSYITEEKRIEYLKEYAELKEKGIISQEEFEEKKKEIFSRKTINK